MRATKYKYYKSEAKVCKKTKKPLSGKTVKAASFVFAVVLAAAALIIPTTTLAPDVDAYEDSKAASYMVGDLSDFAAVISDNCYLETTVPTLNEETTVEETTEAVQETKLAKVTSTEATESEEVETTTEAVVDTQPEVSESTVPAQIPEEEEAEDSSSSVNSGNYLINISNPDPNYSPSSVKLSSSERDKLERLVMGEAGSMSFNGCALVAQCIRDAMNRSNTTSVDRIISEYNYYAPTNKAPNQKVKDAVAYIFDQNGSAVQHRILCFYTGTSGWHETQNFIVGCDNVRFFDMKAA